MQKLNQIENITLKKNKNKRIKINQIVKRKKIKINGKNYILKTNKGVKDDEYCTISKTVGFSCESEKKENKNKLKNKKNDSENCIFCDFVNGNWKTHRNKFVFELIHETKRTISFLSIDFPKNTKEHILVIPKKHFVNISECDAKTLHELIEHVSLVSKAVRLKHQGCNILLNDGRSAEQSVLHTHFHIIPRNHKDNIEIELWKRTNVTKEEYKKLNKDVKKRFDKILNNSK
ncbi:MAG: HIT domain-containing protein [Candidatus ainarchaeum sp.]|nr:HIT domain-containing protein [Candidatus ainarchaeum sp.]